MADTYDSKTSNQQEFEDFFKYGLGGKPVTSDGPPSLTQEDLDWYAANPTNVAGWTTGPNAYIPVPQPDYSQGGGYASQAANTGLLAAMADKKYQDDLSKKTAIIMGAYGGSLNPAQLQAKIDEAMAGFDPGTSDVARGILTPQQQGYTQFSQQPITPKQSPLTPSAPAPSEGLDIDALLKEYLTGMTTGNVEAKTAQEKAVQAQYEQAAGKIGTSVGQGRRTLDTGGYNAALMGAQRDLETQKISQMAQIADTYNQLLQQGYGQAAGVATSLRGQDLSAEQAKRQLDLQAQSLSQEYDIQKAAQSLQNKQFEEQLKQFEKTYGLQLQSSPYAMAKLQRGYDLQDRPWYEKIYNKAGKNYQPSDQENLMAFLGQIGNIGKWFV